ncbi:hypothetical protein SAMN00808754_1673 [Thermanaeromonas toyohensis ToBE]|uniref:Uncharacterized protein n=1 Tax=Thermanaeromonas toyohensis ToBE TaxID=698762 RepID=A0A1W1VU70_9FIRM|nr:hypothetical protein SAMN00808754_1673 [Thermanaeromonas toyohensis ToBE]
MLGLTVWAKDCREAEDIRCFLSEKTLGDYTWRGGVKVRAYFGDREGLEEAVRLLKCAFPGLKSYPGTTDGEDIFLTYDD